MATEVRHRRGTSAQLESFTPAQSEFIHNTDTNRIHVGDGSTVGGIPLAGLADSLATLYSVKTQAELGTITVPDHIDLVWVQGYSGRRTSPVYSMQRVDTEPTHSGKQQDLSGAWFELVSQLPSIKMFGAKGDGVTDDAPAWNALIGYCTASTYVEAAEIDAGVFKFLTDPVSIPKALTITGKGVYNSTIRPATEKGIVANGSSTLVGGVNISKVRIDGSDMPDGWALDIDNVVNGVLEDIIIWNPHNALNARQVGNLGMRKVIIDGHTRGDNLFLAQGSNTTRNGRNDQIDVLSFTDCLFQSDYDGSTTIPKGTGMTIDGRVHSVSFAGMRLLSCLRGLHVKNSFGLAANFVPSFFNGFGLESENTYAEGMLFEAGTHIDVSSIFVARAFRAAGIVIGSNCGIVTLNSVKSGTNYYAGIVNQGAAICNIINPAIYNNGLVASNTYPGIQIGGAGVTNIRDGFSGKALWLPTYSEPQKYGIDFLSGYTGRFTADGVDLTNNTTGTIYDADVANFAAGSYARNCRGYNNLGVVSFTAPASGGSITAGLRSEYVTLFGGSGLVVTVDGVPVANATPAAFLLNPKQVAVITYTTTPTITRNRI